MFTNHIEDIVCSILKIISLLDFLKKWTWGPFLEKISLETDLSSPNTLLLEHCLFHAYNYNKWTLDFVVKSTRVP